MSELYKTDNAYIKVYTRDVDAACYPDGLARSIHMAYSYDGNNYTAMNSNYGILFATAEIRENNTICPKCVKEPCIMTMDDGKYAIIAERVNEDGSEDADCNGKLLLWITSDFITFEDKGLCNIDVKNADAVMEVHRNICDKAALKWSKLYNTGVKVPDSAIVASKEELDKIKAVAIYSDGSTATKRVEWNTDGVKFGTSGTYKVTGKVINEQYRFPLANGYGDPVILDWEGKYYFIATNDNLNDIGLYVREADDIQGLFADGVEEHLILPFDEARGFEQTFWAPEFHMIGGELYILFAVSGHAWGPQCHLMKFKGGSIIDENCWENPIRICKKDGSYLCEDGITLDMTFVKADNASYYVWSYRQHIGTPLDSGSMLYIATVDENDPTKITSDPVLLTRPLYGWENVSGTINNEGPYAFVKDGKVYLAYSGGAANSYTYALGMFTASTGDDLLNLDNWTKSQTAVLSFYSVEGVYGPGHNSFFTDAEGNLMIAYHAETDITSTLRCDGIRRVHFNIDNEPVFDMSAERDLDSKLSNVEMKVIVK